MSNFRVKGVDHVVLRCADVERMERFYCDVLGLSVAKRNLERQITHMRAGASMIDLVPKAEGDPAAPDGRNVHHIALGIEPFDADALVGHLETHGVAPEEVRARFGADGSGPSMYLLDPEGNHVELKGPTSA